MFKILRSRILNPLFSPFLSVHFRVSYSRTRNHGPCSKLPACFASLYSVIERNRFKTQEVAMLNDVYAESKTRMKGAVLALEEDLMKSTLGSD